MCMSIYRNLTQSALICKCVHARAHLQCAFATVGKDIVLRRLHTSCLMRLGNNSKDAVVAASYHQDGPEQLLLLMQWLWQGYSS